MTSLAYTMINENPTVQKNAVSGIFTLNPLKIEPHNAENTIKKN